MIIKYTDFLNEALGVPDFIDNWVDVFMSVIDKNINKFIGNIKNEKNIDVTVLQIHDTEYDAYHQDIKINMDIVIKKLNQEMNIENFEMILHLYMVPGSAIDVSQFEAGFSRELNFQINTIIEPTLEVNIHLPMESLKARNIQKSYQKYGIKDIISECLSHELTHMYEFYRNKFEMTSDSILLEVTNKLELEDYNDISEDWKTFLHFVYLSLQFEINARVSEIYIKIRNDYRKNPDDYEKEDFETSIAESNAWNEMLYLRDFRADEFINSFQLLNIEEVKKIFQIEGEIKDDEDNIVQIVLSYLIWNWDKCLKESVKDWEKTKKKFQIMKEIEIPENKYIKEIPKEFLNDPYSFFKYFEKSFNNKWRSFNRKVMRLYGHFEIE